MLLSRGAQPVMVDSELRLLLVVSQLPYPVINGEDLRVSELARRVAAVHDTEVLAYRGNDSELREVSKWFKAVYLLERTPCPDYERTRLLRVLDAFRPSRMYQFDRLVYEQLKQLLNKRKYDWIWIPSWQMMPYASQLGCGRVLLDVMDDGVLELIRQARCSRSAMEWLITVKRLFVTFLFERQYFSNAACCSVVSEVDARALRRVCGRAKVMVVPNGVDSTYFSPLGLLEEYPSLIFEGNMSFGPNIDAIRYFCAEIWPIVKAHVPQTKLWIVGRNPAEEVLRLQDDAIIVTGSVEDIRPYLDRASVFICPMRQGAGVKNKILQAWAMGKPVVSTTIALGGLSAYPEKNILTADAPDTFAEQTLRLLTDRSLRETLGRQGRQTVRQRHGWAEQSKLLMTVMEELS